MLLHARQGPCAPRARPRVAGRPQLRAPSAKIPQHFSLKRRAVAVAARAAASQGQEERVRQPEQASLDTNAEQQLQEQAAAAAPPAWVASPACLLASLAGFAAITADLYAPNSQRWLFTALDQPLHEWVAADLPPLVKERLANDFLSNSSIFAGCIGWALCTALLLGSAMDSSSSDSGSSSGSGSSAEARGRTLQRLGLAWGTYVAAGGFFIPGDNLLIRTLKHSFARVRPSANHHTFSFPSGHTAAATFTVGLLLFALLPWALEQGAAQRRAAPAQAQPLLAGLQQAGQWLVSRADRVWLSCVGLTIGGRVLADAHWLSDTLAAACVSAALLSGFLMLCARLERGEQA